MTHLSVGLPTEAVAGGWHDYRGEVYGDSDTAQAGQKHS